MVHELFLKLCIVFAGFVIPVRWQMNHLFPSNFMYSGAQGERNMLDLFPMCFYKIFNKFLKIQIRYLFGNFGKVNLGSVIFPL